mgnify:CR=1 FL=1|tara:strand:+ start:1673 stop:1918 length:246 start_codon:yes stop_codon:yes gene_type:complete
MACQIGDLVHIPQATELIDCDASSVNDPQLTIPLRVKTVDSPKVGVVTEASHSGGYVKVYCEGGLWSIRDDSVYTLRDGGE